jgi:hypothetical protein
VRDLIRANWLSTVREISADFGVSYGMCQAILIEDFNMGRISAKFVPCFLHQRAESARLYVVTVHWSFRQISLRMQTFSAIDLPR